MNINFNSLINGYCILLMLVSSLEFLCCFFFPDAILKYRLTLWVESEQFPAMPSANASSLRYFTTTGTGKVLHHNGCY